MPRSIILLEGLVFIPIFYAEKMCHRLINIMSDASRVCGPNNPSVKMAKERVENLTPALFATHLSFFNQILNNNVSVALVFLIVVGENILTIAVTENVMIYEENDTWLWIRDPFNVCNVLKNRNLQTLVGPPEFDVSAANLVLRPSHDRRLTRRFKVETLSAQCQDDTGAGKVSVEVPVCLRF